MRYTYQRGENNVKSINKVHTLQKRKSTEKWKEEKWSAELKMQRMLEVFPTGIREQRSKTSDKAAYYKNVSEYRFLLRNDSCILPGHIKKSPLVVIILRQGIFLNVRFRVFSSTTRIIGALVALI